MLMLLLPVAVLMQASPADNAPPPARTTTIATATIATATVRIIRAEPIRLPDRETPALAPQGARVTQSAARIIVEFY